jgi:hypothetical protein
MNSHPSGESFRSVKHSLNPLPSTVQRSALYFLSCGFGMSPNPQVGHSEMALNPVTIPIQEKSNFHPMGEKIEPREFRDKHHPQEFKLANLRIWDSPNYHEGQLLYSC